MFSNSTIPDAHQTNPSCAETRMYQDKWINAMVADQYSDSLFPQDISNDIDCVW